jgi:ornithine carbamoyltransferase
MGYIIKLYMLAVNFKFQFPFETLQGQLYKQNIHHEDVLSIITGQRMSVVPRLMTLADLSGPQINRLVNHAHHLKHLSMPWLAPQHATKKKSNLRMPSQSLFNKSIALLFSKRSTRTRLAAETAAVLLGGRALFLGSSDIQFGVNESPRDSARVIGGMCQGIFARVGAHDEIEVRKSFAYRSYI